MLHNQFLMGRESHFHKILIWRVLLSCTKQLVLKLRMLRKQNKQMNIYLNVGEKTLAHKIWCTVVLESVSLYHEIGVMPNIHFPLLMFILYFEHFPNSSNLQWL